MASSSHKTGVSDPTYNIISILYHCLQSMETCEQYLKDMKGENELKGFVEKFVQMNRECCEEGKQLLAQCLEREAGEVAVKGKR